MTLHKEAELIKAIRTVQDAGNTFAGDCDGVHIYDIQAELGVAKNGIRGRIRRSDRVQKVRGFDPKRGRPHWGYVIVDKTDAEREPEAAL